MSRAQDGRPFFGEPGVSSNCGSARRLLVGDRETFEGDEVRSRRRIASSTRRKQHTALALPATKILSVGLIKVKLSCL
jgi:hypothetical protein